MSILEITDVASFIGCASTDVKLVAILPAVEDWMVGMLGKNYEYSAAIKEVQDGTGDSYITLKRGPVISVEMICPGLESAISITHDSTTASLASVRVDESKLTLKVRDTGGEVKTEYTLASETLASLVAKIEALSGWAATLADANWGTYPATELVPREGASAKNLTTVELWIPTDPANYLRVGDSGLIYRIDGIWPKGWQNIYAEYAAGWTKTTMPDDMKVAIMTACKWLWERERDGGGITSYTRGDISMSYGAAGYPACVAVAIARYREETV